MGARLVPQSYQYLNLSEGADHVGGQLCGDKECPFSGVTKSGRVWRKVPESGAHSVERDVHVHANMFVRGFMIVFVSVCSCVSISMYVCLYAHQRGACVHANVFVCVFMFL